MDAHFAVSFQANTSIAHANGEWPGQIRSGRRGSASRLHTIVLDVAYVDGATLDVFRSRQAYDQITDRCFRYRDLGTAEGFEAKLDVDDDGFVMRYEGLFARAY